VKLQEIVANQQLMVAELESGKALRGDRYRAVSDYICALSDAEAFEVSQWLGGHPVPGSMYGD
jgi:hypothetical protein